MQKIFWICVVFFSSSLQAHRIEMPRPYGNYNVGYQTLEVTDYRRDDPFIMPAEGRRVRATIYYPTTDEVTLEIYSAEERRAILANLQENLSGYSSSLYYWLNQNILPASWKIKLPEEQVLADALNCIYVPQKAGANYIRGRKFPVIFLIPNIAATSGSYLMFAHQLVTRGYIVVVTAHAGLSSYVEYSDGHTARIPEILDEKIAETTVTEDLAVIAEVLPQEFSAEFADYNHIILMGHGFGGQAILRQTTPLLLHAKTKIIIDPFPNTRRNYGSAIHFFDTHIDKCDFRSRRRSGSDCVNTPGLACTSISDHGFLYPRLRTLLPYIAKFRDYDFLQGCPERDENRFQGFVHKIGDLIADVRH